jgi:hypothetical protein
MKLLFDQNLSPKLNCTTAQVETAFRACFADIEAFEKDTSVGTLVLS